MDAYHRVLCDVHFLEVAAFGGKAVELWSLVVEPGVLCGAESLHRVHLGQFYSFSTHLGNQLLRSQAHVDAKLCRLVLLLSGKVALGLVDIDGEAVFHQ